MAIDTPASAADLAAGRFSPSVRGNILDLDHIWADADGPDSPYQARPEHLQLCWREGLPYWVGLNEQDYHYLARTVRSVELLLARQGTLVKWLPFGLSPQSQHNKLYPEVYLEQGQASGLNTRLYPAFALVAIPTRFRMPSPRYSHTHTSAEMNNHPAVKTRWPGPGFKELRDFMVEAMLEEGVAAWPWPIARRVLDKAVADNYLGIMAVATAPWFAATAKPFDDAELATISNEQLKAKQSPEIKHVATAIAKLDYYLFAAP